MEHHHEKLFIAGPAGQLQAIVQQGENDKPVVIVCHPHPQYGGTMRNKVVYWIARVFEDAGFGVVRFNFRGVEHSEGEWAEGIGETEDAKAVVNWCIDRSPDSPLWMGGFSFGCYAGLKAVCEDDRVQRLFAVAPAVNLHDFGFMRENARPLTVIQGMEDEIVPAEAVQTWTGSIDPCCFIPIPEAGHFFPKHQKELEQAILGLIAS